jgi:type I restriction enzyme M protein
MLADSNPPEFFDAIQAIAGSGDPFGLALTVARMLAAARLWPTSRDGVPGFLEQERELTNADWLAMVVALAKRWKAAPGRVVNPFDRPSEQLRVAPGAFERLRQMILGYLVHDGVTLSVPRWLLQSTLELARPRDLFVAGQPGADSNLRDLIVEIVGATPKTRVFCAYDAAADAALALAANGADVTLDTHSQLAQVCECLALSNNLNLRVRHGDPLQLARADMATAPLLPDAYDASVVAPPFGTRHQVDDNDALGTGLPGPNSIEAAGVVLAIARGKKTAVCLLPPSFLFKSAKADQIFRERAIRDYGLDTVVGLPRGVLSSSTIAAALVVFKPSSASGSRSPKRSSEVLMVNGRGINVRGEWGVGKSSPLASLIRSRESTKHSTSVSIDDLVANDFNLSVDRYVLEPEARRMRTLAAAATTAQLDDIVELYRPQAIPSNKGPASLHQLTLIEVGVADIDESGLVRFPSKEVMVAPEIDLQLRRARLEAGDVLLVIKGSVGKVGFVREVPRDATWVASQSFAILRLRQHTLVSDPRVLFRFLASGPGLASILSLRVGSTVPGLQMADVRRLPIVVPDKEKQRSVALEVEGLFRLQDQIQKLRSELWERQSLIWPESLGTGAAHRQAYLESANRKSTSRRKRAP